MCTILWCVDVRFDLEVASHAHRLLTTFYMFCPTETCIRSTTYDQYFEYDLSATSAKPKALVTRTARAPLRNALTLKPFFKPLSPSSHEACLVGVECGIVDDSNTTTLAKLQYFRLLICCFYSSFIFSITFIIAPTPLHPLNHACSLTSPIVARLPTFFTKHPSMIKFFT